MELVKYNTYTEIHPCQGIQKSEFQESEEKDGDSRQPIILFHYFLLINMPRCRTALCNRK